MSTRKKSLRGTGKQELLQYMDLLHGDVIDDEHEAACWYEYARQSEHLKYAAKLFRRGKRLRDWGHIKLDGKEIPHPSNLIQDVTDKTSNRFGGANWFKDWPWPEIWECSSFPKSSWNSLGEGDRKQIAYHFCAKEIQPLRMLEAWRLNALGVFSDLKLLAIDSMPDDQTSDIKSLLPTVHKDRWTHALFTLDFSKTKKQLVQEFGAWLDLPENKKRLAAHRKDTTGTTGAPRDHLKALATWQLREALGFEKMLKFAEDNRKLDKAGKKRPFHDEHPEQASNLKRLCSEPSVAQKAITRAKKYLAQIMPGEFTEQPHVKEADEIGKRLKDLM